MASGQRPGGRPVPAAPASSALLVEDAARGDLARMTVARPVLTAVLLALVPTVFELIGNWGGGYAAHHTPDAKVSTETLWLLVLATCMGMCALVAVFAMAQAAPTMRGFGWRGPRRWSGLAWLAPLVLLAAVWLRDGVAYAGSGETPLVIYVVVMAVVQVVWCQGIVQAVLRPRGRRYAMVTTSVIAALVGVLPQLVGQVAYQPEQTGRAMPVLLTRAATVLLLTLVACGLVEVTGSLWVPLVVRVAIELAVLHGLYLDARIMPASALVALAVLAAWAGVMYTRLPADPVVDDD